jgi:hypothetical protein
VIIGIVCGPSVRVACLRSPGARIHGLVLGPGGVAQVDRGEQASDPVGVQPLACRGVIGDHPDEQRYGEDRTEKVPEDRRRAEADHAYPGARALGAKQPRL